MRRSVALLGLVSLLVASVPRFAAAQTGGADEISLKNGGMLRGTVVAVEPGKEAVILIQGTGEQRHVPWAEIDKVSRGKDAAPSAPPPPPPSAEGTAPASGSPRVHIQTDWPGIGLQQVTASMVVVGYGGAAYGQLSRQVCIAPCDQVVDTRGAEAFFL